MGSLFPFFGLNFIFWGLMGLLRLFSERLMKERRVSARRINGALVLLFVTLVSISLGRVTATSIHSFTIVGEMEVHVTILKFMLAFWFNGLAAFGALSFTRTFGLKAVPLVAILFFSLWSMLTATILDHTFSAENFLSGSIVSILFIVVPVVCLRRGRVPKIISEQSFSPFTGGVYHQRVSGNEVAVVIPAHNESKTIVRTIHTLTRIMKPEQIFVGSDASTDATVTIARFLDVVVDDIKPNCGKANTLNEIIKRNNLLNRFQAIIFVDADSEIPDDYLSKVLPVFDDPTVAAVAVHALSKWEDHWPPKQSLFFSAYRIRFYRVLQAVLRYGQAWRYLNVVPIIPGFASMYRSEVLKRIEINAPGLVIEDFNMTFEIHHKKLGRVAYLPWVRGVSRDPLCLRDYIKQVKRWNLGFWQTVRRHGIWASFFWCTLAVFIIEMLVFGVCFLVLPFLLIASLVFPNESRSFAFLFGVSAAESVLAIIALLIIADYLLTAAVALYERKPILLLYGLGFIVIRYIDNFLFLYTLPLAFIKKSDGRWVSPNR